MLQEKNGPSPEEMGINPEEQKSEHFRERANVNGIEFSVEWDKDYDGYAITFPELDDASTEAIEPFNPRIRLSKKTEVAKQIFDFASENAKNVDNAYDLYREVQKLARTLPYDGRTSTYNDEE